MTYAPVTFADLAGRTAVVTGAARGIGAALARSLVRNGANVVAADQDFERMRVTAQELAGDCADGARIIPVQADVQDPEQHTGLANTAVSRFGGLECWVNNAGVFGTHGVLDITADALSRMIQVNLNGAVFGAQAAARAMGKHGGTIVNITSIAASVVRPTMAAYGGSKAAIEHFARFLAVELGPRNVRVNNVAPGMIATDMLDWVTRESSQLEMTIESIPLRRLGEPQDVANAALFLLSNASRFITGQTLIVDGGVRNR